MNKASSELCPKCNKPFIEKREFNSNYNIYIHKRKEGSHCLSGLITYCIVTIDYKYIHPINNKAINKLHPDYRKPKLQE